MDFLENGGILIYFFIFFGKILEVTVATVRVVLINRGEKKIGSIIAFFEILLWLLITGTVLVGFQEDMIRVVVFALAFAIGNYLGSWLEGKLAVGYCSIQIIVTDSIGTQTLIDELRNNNYAVTMIKGQGKDGERDLLILHLLRKRIPTAIEIVKSHLDNAFIIINDVKKLHGGYIKK
jgi:uncharacterized protein YebE (UPF0316 family)